MGSNPISRISDYFTGKITPDNIDRFKYHSLEFVPGVSGRSKLFFTHQTTPQPATSRHLFTNRVAHQKLKIMRQNAFKSISKRDQNGGYGAPDFKGKRAGSGLWLLNEHMPTVLTSI